MDFEVTYTEEQQRFRREVRAWLDANVTPGHPPPGGSRITGGRGRRPPTPQPPTEPPPMDFEVTYTEEQQRFRREVRAWLDANVTPGLTRIPISDEDSLLRYRELRAFGRK